MQSGRALVLSAPHQRGDAASLENTLRTIDASCERLAKTLETERACSPSPRASLIVPRPRREEHRGAGGADEGAPRGARLPAQRGGPDAHRAADSLAEAGHGARTEPRARVAAGGAPGACTFQWVGGGGKKSHVRLLPLTCAWRFQSSLALAHEAHEKLLAEEAALGASECKQTCGSQPLRCAPDRVASSR